MIQDSVKALRLLAGSAPQSLRGAQLRQTLLDLQADAVLRNQVLAELDNGILGHDWRPLFSETPGASARGFLSGLASILVGSLLGPRLESQDGRQWLMRLLSLPGIEGDWTVLNADHLMEWLDFYARNHPSPQRARLHLEYAGAEALRRLAVRLSAILIDPDFSRFHKPQEIMKSPLLQLQQCLFEATEEGPNSEFERRAEALIGDINTLLNEVTRGLEQTGVSLNLVYQIADLEQTLIRIGWLIQVLSRGRSTDLETMRAGIRSLMVQQRQQQGARSYLSRHLDLLLRRIVERTGQTGEHYIARSASQYWQLFFSSLGGGSVTSVTALLKTVIAGLKLPLFFDGLFTWCNYSSSFLLMQGLHFSLASKQPAMTAPALASRLRNLGPSPEFHAFIQEVTQLTRSQFITTIGNLIAVIPCAWIVNRIYLTRSGQNFYTFEYAAHALEQLTPHQSWTLPFAALTGVILWVSSLVAGAVENWTTYQRIGDAIRCHPGLSAWLGTKKTHRLAAVFERHVAGAAGCLAIGFLLAFVPVLGRFFGLGLEVRHVTLSAGTWTYAITASAGRLTDALLPWTAFLGVIMIGFLNISVSFSLALAMAVRARRLPESTFSALKEALHAHLRLRPLDFFFPTGDDKGDESH